MVEIILWLKAMRLLDNHQLILITIQPKGISLEQICCKRSQGIAVTSLHCLPFSKSKNKDLNQISKSATNVVLPLRFFVTSKIVFPSNVLTLKLNCTLLDQSDHWNFCTMMITCIMICCMMFTYLYSSNFSKKIFWTMFSALQCSCSMNPGSSFIDDFLFTSFQKKNKNTKGKYPNEIQIMTVLLELNEWFVWRERCIDFKRNLTDGNLIRTFLKGIWCCNFHG